ncbi:E3 ubiquitin/ISG15 ligase TRIM25-like [Mantella aurantiaca]
MASADLRQELDCSIGLTIYTDPVNLRCGHNFCRVCIDRVLDTQDGSGGYSCPECREEFQDRPTLQRNITLRNIVETFRSTEPDQETGIFYQDHLGIFCTHCIHSPVLAVKSCLHCEASLCNDHLRVHSKSSEHVLTEPTTSMEKRKCSVHKELLKYYCTADAACICVSCSLAGEHQGHKVETLDEASERKKQKLRTVLQKMMNMREKTEKRVQSLRKCKGKVQEDVAGERERVTALITDLRRQLEDLEKRVLREISRQEERLLHPLSDLIQQLEIKKDHLSRKMGDIEELCNMTDPLTVLQESHTGDLCDIEEGDNEDRERHDKLLHDGGGLDVTGISHTLHTGLSDMMKGVNAFLNIQEAADILLDVNTAHNNLQISDDRKTASRSDIKQNRPETPERFQYYIQVLSSRRFSSGRHYWEVDVRGSDWWFVGMSYPSIKRRGFHFSLLLSAMASADLRDELDCSICLDIYTDPVNLRCGHNFCRLCIDHVLDTQDRSGGYSCPECRQRFRSRPKLQRNITLRNIVEAFRSTQLDEGETGIFCSYCIRFSMPAIKSCLMCEASLCEKHLKVHSKSPEHVLTELTTYMEKRKCSVHQKILEYYCTMEATCICVSCSLTGEHQGHKVETLDEASGKKKKKLRDDLQRLVTEREVIQKKVQGLHEHRRNIQQRVTGEKERVTTLLIHLRRQLENLEKRVLREISRQEEQQLHPLSDRIQQLETKKDDLSRKMGDIEELCNMTDPMTVLQESHTGDLCDTEDGDNEDRERQDKLLHDGEGLDVSWIPHTLHTGLSNMMKEVNVFFNIQETTDILLDINTAHHYLHISDDMKSVSWSNIKQNRPEKPERFENCSQVLSRQTFSSGRYYWEVDVSQSERWIVGMCYPSTERTGWFHSWIGHNNKSWGLYRHDSQCSVIHDSTVILSIGNIPHKRVRIYLDYEAGRLSLYELCDPIRHLHTFTTTFTEPLHVALWMGKGCIKIPGGSGDVRNNIG